MRRLYRSSHHRVIGGVCGGLAEYLDVSPAVVRVLMLILGCMGTGVVLYLVGMLIMPREPSASAPPAAAAPQRSGDGVSFTFGLGALLIVIGGVLLLDRLDLFHWHVVWTWARNIFVPAAIIVIGVAILVRRRRAPGAAAPANAAPLEQAPLRSGQWYRARSDRKILGVCAGIAHAMDVDPTVIRLAWVLLSLHSLGMGVVVYLILALVLPEEPLPSSS